MGIGKDKFDVEIKEYTKRYLSAAHDLYTKEEDTDSDLSGGSKTKIHHQIDGDGGIWILRKRLQGKDDELQTSSRQATSALDAQTTSVVDEK